ncbi:RagB/SusD family nutrient uptake outer membrane protein [Chitinophaga arvensicola]|uniref:Starch-binding associating with outer membrane n=1 Tax=Chitinophaga arvensicola TaxID=29529 RepID=A0A1I0R7M6_9BACT|nr:RagB/SusD family nutrient uptake outer membrane protein [Chitinophaga arvensicola]SEW36670.1 Starch-binding associating with outer membrane [Chitinophaga arvensicola]
MKRIIYYCLIGSVLLATGSCKKFLDVSPPDRMSDAAFWQTKGDVESAIANAYGFIFDILTKGPYVPANGDIRAGEFTAGSFDVFAAVAAQDLTNNSRLSRYNMKDLSDWYPFYQSIAACNIDLVRVPDVKALTPGEVKQYVAELRFVRAFTYFYISRIYGDVPLYVDAYDQRPLPRTPMVDVLKFCLAEMEAIKDDLPWQYDEPSKWGVRAARGAVYALIANANMWAAGFDKANQQQYWQGAAAAIKAMEGSKAFDLLQIEDFRKIFKGRTKESLFEFSVNANYGTTTRYVSIGQWTLHSPLVLDYATSDCYFDAEYLKKIFPSDMPDKRLDLWFFSPFANNTSAMFVKYSNVVNMATSTSWLLDDDLIMFRYSGELLLGAEALANLNQDGEAIRLLNLVRARAGAPAYSGTGNDALKQFIFLERQRELIGEGVRWYDLVRTGRVTDPTQCKSFLTPEQFSHGGWTWPIDAKARNFNPNITLNTYWTK